MKIPFFMTMTLSVASVLSGRAILDIEPIEIVGDTTTMGILSKASHTKAVDLAFNRAIATYGEETMYGRRVFSGVSKEEKHSPNGDVFLYAHILGDGNCGFYASGITRERFIDAVNEVIDKNHDAYTGFVAQREALTQAIEALTQEEKDKLDGVLQRVNDFKTLANLEDGSLEARNIEESVLFLRNGWDEEADNPDDSQFQGKSEGAKNKAEKFQDKKTSLVGNIANIEYPQYEAFVRGAMYELALQEKDLQSKDTIKAAIKKVFEKNSGSLAWFPGGLLMGIDNKLGVRINIWGYDKDKAGREVYTVVRLNNGRTDDGRRLIGTDVRNIIHTGGHYDMLIPIMPGYDVSE